MNKKLTYCVGDHYFCIETPDAEITSKILWNYQPFLVENCSDKEFLFTLRGNEQISTPDSPTDDRAELNGVSYEVFHQRDKVVVAMKNSAEKHLFSASSDWREVACDFLLTDERRYTFMNSFLRMAYAMTSIHRKTIKIHASVTELNGKALVFLGKSGTGKSTHSRLWREFIPGCSLLNDDEPLIRVFDDKSVRVYGAPWSGSTPCYRNEWAEVKAFVHLYQSPENKLTKLRNIEALSSIYGSSAVLRSDSENKEMSLDIVSEILRYVPVYRLDCRPDEEAVSLTRSLLP